MKQDKKDIAWFKQVVDPAFRVDFLRNNPLQFALGYRNVSADEKEFLVKFKIVSPKNNRKEVVEVTHGYLFSVREDFILVENFNKLAGFFSFLVTESLKQVNRSLPEGKIKIPSRKSLLKAIYLMLLSRVN